MKSQIRLMLNFWESKQLEYWLNDNYPECTIRELYDRWTKPEEEQMYAVEGKIPLELECWMKLKYSSNIKGVRG